MDTIIIILITIAIGIIGVLAFLGKSQSKKQQNNDHENEANNNRRVERRINPRLQRNQLNRIRANRNQNNALIVDEEDDLGNRRGDNESDDDDSDDTREAAEREELRKKIGTKKLAKIEEKAAKREEREQMLRDREEKKEKEEKMYEERKKREEVEERLEKEKEEAEKRAKEEQEKREHEEYLKLKEQFTVEEEGQDQANIELDSQNLLQEFVDYIKDCKIVVLEDLACEFKLKTQEIINRLNLVQEMGLLTGVMDDRGKFIFISEGELLKVKQFIEQRGRVNLTELAKSSNELINLKPVIKINNENNNIVETNS